MKYSRFLNKIKIRGIEPLTDYVNMSEIYEIIWQFIF